MTATCIRRNPFAIAIILTFAVSLPMLGRKQQAKAGQVIGLLQNTEETPYAAGAAVFLK